MTGAERAKEWLHCALSARVLFGKNLTFCSENVRFAQDDLRSADVPTRYPDAVIGSKPSGLPSREDAQEAFQIAKSIFEQIYSKLKSN